MTETTPPTTHHPTAPTTPSTLTSRLHELVQAACSAIWITTREPTEALRDLTTLCRTEGWRLRGWDWDQGMSFPLAQVAIPGVTDTRDPLAVIRALPQISQGAGTTLVTLESLHTSRGTPSLRRRAFAG